MKIRSFIKMVYRTFGTRSFKTKSVYKRMFYTVYPISMNAIYIAMHKCWKMGLLSRRRSYGPSYTYYITAWGIRYVTDGYKYRDEIVQLKLLGYITQYGNKDEKVWAEEMLVPRLLQRFLPGRSAQKIIPYVNFSEALDNAPNILRMRIQDEAIEPDDEFPIQCEYDLAILSQTARLMRQLYHNFNTELDFNKFRKSIEDTINEVSTYKPPVCGIITGLGTPRKMYAESKSKPRIERRPNASDYKKIENVCEKLEELTKFFASN